MISVYIYSYIENSEYYGQSGKESFFWVISDERVKMVSSFDSKRIERLVPDREDSNVYYLMEYDYLTTMNTGVFIARITVKDGKINYEPDVIHMNTYREFFKQEGVLHGDSEVLFKDICDDGRKVTVGTENERLTLELGKHKEYECEKGKTD